MISPRLAVSLVCAFALSGASVANAAAPSEATKSAHGAYHLTDPSLKLVPIDTDPTESFLGLAVDGTGRLFAGAREALFVYEPNPHVLYQPRKLLCRFPKDAWVYDVAIRGHDLYVLTTGALYLLRDGVVKREGLVPERLLWGMPVSHVHQGLHGMTFGPDGDLYISLGDELVYYGDYRRRPDHFGHWTLYHGPDQARTPYTGVGGVLRLSPDGQKLSVISNGTRNDCGLAFDEQWNLFGNDNDHESMPNDYVPGRLLHITPHSYFNWPRGWMIEKQPWRSDLLDTMTPGLGRYVPVGMVYYGDSYLGEKYRHALYVPEWGSRKIAMYPLRAARETFKTTEQLLLTGQDDARPVSVAVGRGGRMFAAICFMVHNEGSPMYRSDLVMITRANDAPAAPFTAFDEVAATPDQLFAELNAPDWSRRFRAHLELTRRGAPSAEAAAAKLAALDPASVAAPHLIWLAAADPSPEARARVLQLSHHADANVRVTAVRAMARFGVAGSARDVFLSALKDPDPRVCLAALTGLFDQTHDLPFEQVAAAACETPSYIRQAAMLLLARRAAISQLQSLCASADLPRRRAGVVAIGFRLTLPEWDQPLDPTTPLDASKSEAYRVTYAGNVTEVLTTRAPMGNFTASEAWERRAKTPDDEALLHLLQARLTDSDSNLAKQSALYLRLLADPASESQVNALLGFPAPPGKATPIANATATGLTELPEAYRKPDWNQEAKHGDAKRGQELFLTRGCTVCHSIKEGDPGGGAPSLAGAGSRFTAQYLVESVITPNKVVAPLFRWTFAKLKNGDVVTGLVTSETGAELEFLLPAGIRRTVKKSEIVSREVQNRSPMPEGLIQNPEELRDLVAFLLAQKGAQPAGAQTGAAAGKSGAAAPKPLPRYNHVVIVLEENKNPEQIIGNEWAPYINSVLAKEGAVLTKMYGEEHHSEGNYFWLLSGGNFGMGFSDAMPKHPIDASNLAEQLMKRGFSFKGYAENLPAVGSEVKIFPLPPDRALYARKHVPWVSFSNIPPSASVPFTDFPKDPAKFKDLPTLSIVIPNLLNDMHDGKPKDSVPLGDAWLKSNIDAYYQWARANNSLLIVTFDENDDKLSYLGLTNPSVEPGDGPDQEFRRDVENRIPTIFAGAHIKPGEYSEGKGVTHVNILRTLEAMYGLRKSGAQQPNAEGIGISDDYIISDPFQ